ncbi:hypothetical protein P3342_011820 [Pyrenophora teres f. teres]|nr:hypothetical protein PTNB85_10360 [Pyrenophora teres f. teres]KAK1911218.1 hypothetical protein P3342_011820 [Pyrenophora teres f. teres]
MSCNAQLSSPRPSFTPSPPPRSASPSPLRVSPKQRTPKSSPSEPAREDQLQRVYDFLERYSERSLPGSDKNKKFIVSPDDWLSLKDEIFVKGDKISRKNRTWAIDKLYYHYNADANVFEIKIVTSLHEDIRADVASLIREKLDRLAQDDGMAPAVKAIIDAIGYKGQPTIALKEHSSRSPDFVFHSGEYPATFVGEVAHSQDGKEEFGMIAEEYISGTNGSIKTVLGIDIEYRTPETRQNLANIPRAANYQIFRRRIDVEKKEMLVESGELVEFQDAMGVVAPGSQLRLTLADLTQTDTIDLSNFDIEISHQELFKIVSAAEATQAKEDAYKVATPEYTFHSNLQETSIDSQEDYVPELEDSENPKLSDDVTVPVTRDGGGNKPEISGDKRKRRKNDNTDADSRCSARHKTKE